MILEVFIELWVLYRCCEGVDFDSCVYYFMEGINFFIFFISLSGLVDFWIFFVGDLLLYYVILIICFFGCDFGIGYVI